MVHANDESLVNWQTVMNRHHPSWSWQSADMSQTAQMVTGRCDLSWSGWSANIFTSLHNTAIKIIKVFLEQTNCQYGHHPSQVVVICPDRDNPPTISPPFKWQTVKGCYHLSWMWRSADMSQTDKRWWAVTTRHGSSPVWWPITNQVYWTTLQVDDQLEYTWEFCLVLETL